MSKRKPLVFELRKPIIIVHPAWKALVETIDPESYQVVVQERLPSGMALMQADAPTRAEAAAQRKPKHFSKLKVVPK